MRIITFPDFTKRKMLHKQTNLLIISTCENTIIYVTLHIRTRYIMENSLTIAPLRSL
mgnify:CR=1 FL=1